jgi:hypothetical protein
MVEVKELSLFGHNLRKKRRRRTILRMTMTFLLGLTTTAMVNLNQLMNFSNEKK